MSKKNKEIFQKPIPIQSSQRQFNEDNNINNDKNNPYKGVVASSVNIYDIKKDVIEKEVTLCKLRLQYCITIFIFVIVLCDIIIEISYEFINYFGMIDNIIVLVLLVKLLMICIKKKNFFSNKLSIIIAIIVVCGFGLKGLSLSFCMMKENVNLLLIYGLIIGIRTFGLIWLFPFTCKK